MKEYQYSIIRRESRNPKRNREGRGISQSDLEALKQELDGNSRGLVSAIYDRDIALDSLAVTSGDISERLKTAEEALTGKLDSGDFSTWRTGELAKALASKQPKGSYVDPSQLATSQQQAVAEAVKQAEEMDKQIKVGGRNLITRASLLRATTDDGYGWVFESDNPDSFWLSESRDYPQAKAGDTVTLSMLIRCDKSEWGASEWVIRVSDSQGSLEYLDQNKEVFGEFYRHTWTFDLREGGKLPNVQLYNHVWRKDENGRIRFNKRIEAKYIKLERGTVATDWTPAPEDVEESVSKLTSQLDIHDKTLGSQAEALGEQKQTLKDQNTRLTEAEEALKKKLESSEFDKYKTSIRGELGKYATSAALERLRAAMDKEVSHWTREEHPNPIDAYKTLADLKTIQQPWEAGDDPERHIGDLCTVIGKTQTDKGVSYRFVKHDTADTCMWIKVVDNDGILALNAHNQFLVTYKERQDALDADAKETQKTIDAINKKLGGTKIDLDKLNQKAAEQQQHIDEMQAQYKVTVTTRGSIRNGDIVDGVTQGGSPAILHTAHVYGTDGKEISDTETLNKLVWTVNKGRTTAPQQFVVPGATCYVTEKDLVKSPDNPNYYDIELNSNF